MIVENYTADFYCDCAICSDGNMLDKKQAEIIGHTQADVYRQARKLGWHISKDKQFCYAPGHAMKRGSYAT